MVSQARKPATRDNHFAVRHAAALALGNLGDRRAIPALRALPDDADESVRDAEQGTLGTLRK